MGFWGVLGNIGKGLLGVGGAGAANSAAGRRTDAEIQGQLNAQNNRALLDAAQFNVGVPMARAQQTARGDLMSAPIPQASATGSGRDLKLSGGVGPQWFGEDTTAAGEALKRQALRALMTGSDRVTPQMSTLKKPGLLERIGAIAGLGGAVMGAMPRSFSGPSGVYEPSDDNGWG